MSTIGSFENLKSRLNGSLDILPPSLMPNLINDALSDIYKANDWGFLKKVDFMRTPALINQGTVSVTKYLNTVILDATASAIVLALTVNEIPLTERQFRTNSSAITGRSFLYSITDFDIANPAAIVLTIDPYYLDNTNAAANFQILKTYYNPPYISATDERIDFKGWDYFINLRFQRKLNVDTTLEELNNFDPSRYYVDEPRHIVPHPANANGFPLFEMYPAPRFERVYRVQYRRKGLPLVEDEDNIGNILSEELVLSRSKYRLYEFAIANADKYQLKSVGRFQNLMALEMNPNNPYAFPSLLVDAKKDDEEAFPKAYLGSYLDVPYFDSMLGGSFNNQMPPAYSVIINY